jgi:Mn2+/Fe2+ NRAMP family transporter
VAATGVGAGDLATAAFTGGQLGVGVLWAVVVGAALKLALTEGLARWQLATGTTLLEGVCAHLGRAAIAGFLAYLLLWSLFVGSAVMSACGVTLHALIPVFADASRGKQVFGLAASAAGLGLVVAGGYRAFERLMSICIGLMFVTVVLTAGLVWPDTAAVARGLVVPSIPDLDGQGLAWTVALMGGVGGTVTILCYGYWIREEGRAGLAELRVCRADLGVGYAMTALFGLAMVIIGSAVAVEGSGAGLVVALAGALEAKLGASGRWVFLAGAFGAVFSSLLGVWQAVPYLFADCVRLLRRDPRPASTASPSYRAYLLALAVVPALGLSVGFRELQKLYAIVGAAFMPLLALALLALTTRRTFMGDARSRWLATSGLAVTVALFGWIAAKSWLG